MPARKKPDADVYVAKHSFASATYGFVTKDERVRAGHPLLDSNPDSFEPVDSSVKYDVEQATDAPGEKRER